VAKKKHRPDPVILALMGEAEREKLLNRNPNRKRDRSSDEEIREAGKAAANRLIEKRRQDTKKSKPSRKKGLAF
jgi:hypothetical protein